MNIRETTHEGRKSVGQYNYSPKDVIGKGYSSTVYRATNEQNGTPPLTQVRL